MKNNIISVTANTIVCVCVFSLSLCASETTVDPFYNDTTGISGIKVEHIGGNIPNDADYKWWHGCSPTSAGMLMGYYDRNGYEGQAYDNLVPGGVAEASTFGTENYMVNNIIASQGHIDDFYKGGYANSGDDVSAPFHEFNCLADFMGTSQDAYGNSNGSTSFYNWTDSNDPLTSVDIEYYGLQDNSGMYGIGEYIRYAGYDYDTLYSQHIEGYNGNAGGFTLDDYINSIDDERPVIIQIEGHSMLGVGYDDQDNSTIYVHDTWSEGDHAMPWGGTYSGLQQTGVTVVGLVPEPNALIFLFVFAILIYIRRSILRLISPLYSSV